ncbi:MAG TPA: hypothetical protein DGG94_18405, partial [Micromonosporaceae bacterium]|nr:hypothetical protein [Micromonosporaceae bacterium]
MNLKVVLAVVSLVVSLVGSPLENVQTEAVVQAATSTELTTGWALRSANNVSDTGTVISQPGYNAGAWSPITLPSTVLAGLVANNVYQNIYFGQNLKSVPDLAGRKSGVRGK